MATRRQEERNGYLAALPEMGFRETSVLLLVRISSERPGSDPVHKCVVTLRNVLRHHGGTPSECDHGAILLVWTDETTWLCLKTVEAWISI